LASASGLFSGSSSSMSRAARAGFLGDLRLGAALFLERQIDVFQARLGIRRQQRLFDLRRQLPCSLMLPMIATRRSSIFAQIAQALFQRAELDVVEHPGRFLAITGDEGERGAAVEQVDGGLNLCVRGR